MTARETNTAGRPFDWEALKRRTSTAVAAVGAADELEGIFAARALALARVTAEDDHAHGTTLLCFHHGEMSFGVELTAVLRVLRPRRLTRIPHAPAHIDRVLHEGGRIVAALDPSRLFGRAVQGTDCEPIILLDADGVRLGVRATRVIGPRPFDAGRLGTASSGLDARTARCVRGIAEDLTIVLDGHSLVQVLKES